MKMYMRDNGRRQWRTAVMAALLIIFGISSCEKAVSDDDEYSGNSGSDTPATSTLKVSTRGLSGDVTVSYPVNVYVFDSKDKCVGIQTVAKASDAPSFSLSKGTYHVYAIGGATSDRYSLPTIDEATPTSVISLIEGKEHADLMSASQTLNIEDGETATLSLSLSRRVMKIGKIEIYEVPSTAQSVQLEIMPVYENICLNGTLTGTAGSIVIPLQKSGTTTTWTNTASPYSLESLDNATVKITIVTSSKTKSYIYSCKSRLYANYILNMYGTYKSSGIVLCGSISGTTWSGENNISFDLNSDGTTTGDESLVPPVGSLYDGAFVLGSEMTDENTVQLLLLSMNEVTGLLADNTSYSQSQLESIVENALATLSTSDGKDWRLPTGVEMKTAVGMAAEINAKAATAGISSTFSEYYLYHATSIDEIRIMSATTGNTLTEFTSRTKLRGVRTVTLQVQK